MNNNGMGGDGPVNPVDKFEEAFMVYFKSMLN
jgi:hypothetical protein